MTKKYLSLFFLTSIIALGEVNIYGPGGPAPVFKEISEKIMSEKKEKINLKVGPTGSWIEQAKNNGDLIFSGSEFMMSDFTNKLKDIDKSSIRAIKFREAGILVRDKNPKKLKTINDLAKENVNVIVVDGAGQISLWEDMVGKTKDISLINKVRKNIKYFAPNSALAVKRWEEDESVDAVIIWKPWEKRFENSNFVELDDENKIFRPALVALTEQGNKNPEAKRMYNEILSSKYDDVWKKYGWED